MNLFFVGVELNLVIGFIFGVVFNFVMNFLILVDFFGIYLCSFSDLYFGFVVEFFIFNIYVEGL